VTAPAWLVVVDMQAVFADEGSPWRTPRYADAAAGVRALLPAFSGRTVWTRFIAPTEPRGSWVPYYEEWGFAREPASSPIWAISDLDPGSDPVVDEPTFGKWGLHLAEITGDAPLVLAGVSTDCCVLSTALAAADEGRFVRVAGDACAGASDVDHRRALEAMALYRPLITITDVAAVLAAGA
jgi:nicotinamidase-related amidase